MASAAYPSPSGSGAGVPARTDGSISMPSTRATSRIRTRSFGSITTAVRAPARVQDPFRVRNRQARSIGQHQCKRPEGLCMNRFV